MTTLITNSQFKQFDANGEPLAGGKIYTYIVGTTTDKVTYQDEDKVAAHTNPIILDAWGEATVWIDGDTRFYVTDSNDVEIRNYPVFSASVASTESPVNPSPDGAVLRSTATETGYLKIRLPMNEWPNTKMMFDVNIYTDEAGEALRLTLSGYADSNTSAWLTTTAITNGVSEYTIQFGNDGTYPAIYIGGVSSSWVKPQVAVTNFMAGQFSHDWTTWNDGWEISITTSLGIITATPTLVRKYMLATTGETVIGTETEKTTTPAGVKAAIDNYWGDWVAPSSFETGFLTNSTVPIMCRTSSDGNQIQITGGISFSPGTITTKVSVDAATLPYSPAKTQYIVATFSTVSTTGTFEFITCSVASDGVLSIKAQAAMAGSILFNSTIPIVAE